MSATYTHTLAANFGAARTGQAANVVAKVYDSGNTLQATVTSWVEDTDGTNGLGSYRGTFTANPAWSGGRVVYSITGAGGMGYVDPFAADPVAAGILANATAGGVGGVPAVDANGNVAANAARLGGQAVTAAGAVTVNANVGFAAAPGQANGGIAFGAGAGQVNPAGGKTPVTLAAGDVTGALPANVVQIGGDTNSVVSLVDNIGLLDAPISNLPAAVWGNGTRTITGGATSINDAETFIEESEIFN